MQGGGGDGDSDGVAAACGAWNGVMGVMVKATVVTMVVKRAGMG